MMDTDLTVALAEALAALGGAAPPLRDFSDDFDQRLARRYWRAAAPAPAPAPTFFEPIIQAP